MNRCLYAHSRLASYIECSNALGAIHLVRSHGQQINRPGLQIDGNLPRRLHGIAMKQYAMLAAEPADPLDILYNANLVIHHHDGYKNRVWLDGIGNALKGYAPIGLYIEVGDAKPRAFQIAYGIQDSLMLGSLSDDVPPLMGIEPGRALDRQVVAFRRARGPDDLAGIGIQQVGDMLARLLHGLLRLPAIGMAARGRIAEAFAKIGNHCLRDARVDGRGGPIVHIDWKMNACVFCHRQSMLGTHLRIGNC